MSPVPVRARVAAGGPAPLRAPRPTTPRRALPASRPSLKAVDDARLRSALRQRRGRRLLVAAAALVGASLLALAAAHAVMVSTQVHLDELEHDVAEAQARHQALRLEVATLEAPDRVVSVARQRLGMAPPDRVTYLHAAAAPASEWGEEPVRSSPGSSSGGRASDAQPSWGAIKPYLGSGP